MNKTNLYPLGEAARQDSLQSQEAMVATSRYCPLFYNPNWVSNDLVYFSLLLIS